MASPLVNTAPINPDLKELGDDYKKRLKASAGTENQADSRLTDQYNQYQSRLGADTTKRAIGRATLANADVATGQKMQAAERAASMGQTGTGAAADVASRADEAARNRSARSAADISLGREGQLDALTLGGLGIAGAQSNLNLARAGQTNSLYGGAASAIGAAGQQNLAERGLGLNQYQTQAQIDLARQQAEQARVAQQEQAYRAALTAIPSSGVSAPFPGANGNGGGGVNIVSSNQPAYRPPAYAPQVSGGGSYRPINTAGYGLMPG